MIQLTDEQTSITNQIISQVKSNRFLKGLFITIVGGYAGTGKTSLICEMRKRLEREIKSSVAFLTFTGKASSVLKSRLTLSNTIYDNDYIGTIHGLIYKPETRWDKQLKTFVITGWKLRDVDEIWFDLIIIDEASMVSKSIWKDLLSFQIPIIAVGDHGQLPPIGDNFSLMKDPDFTLKEIHRQALNSPIIKLSKFIREEGYIPEQIFSPEVFKINWNNKACKKTWNGIDFRDDGLIILCGFNTTRANLNDRIRTKLGFKKRLPYPNEKIVCLKNNHQADIMNGQIGTTIWVMPETDGLYRITVQIDGEMYEVLVADKCFGEVQYTLFDKYGRKNALDKYAGEQGYGCASFFDYGYVISVHKSQGAEWNRVILIEQRTNHWDDEYYARWLYTAVTRAREKLMIINNMWI